MSFFRKIITCHDTGLGEAYMDDDFDVRTIAPSLAIHGSAIPHPFSVTTVRSQEQNPEVKTGTFQADQQLRQSAVHGCTLSAFQVDDLGALMAVVTSNAGNIESSRGALGLLNRLGDWLLMLAHRARANTVSATAFF